MMIHEAGGKNNKFQWQKAALFDIMAMNCKKKHKNYTMYVPVLEKEFDNARGKNVHTTLWLK